jgi:hypothetical protein
MDESKEKIQSENQESKPCPLERGRAVTFSEMTICTNWSARVILHGVSHMQTSNAEVKFMNTQAQNASATGHALCWKLPQ